MLFSSLGVDFECAMTILATVISRPTADRAITDAGRKSIHPGVGVSRVINPPGVELVNLHAEHGFLAVTQESSLEIGAKVEIIPNYADGTINLFPCWVVTQNDRITDLWPISGRDCSY
jgi:D-serine deaminase-like pyridoxal phosphate-dependent protein